jgi:HEAT repeat protein
VGPFRGLAPYLEEDAGLFFGRDEERKALLQVVTGTRGSVILVTGESGVGKTSLLRAGLVARLPRDRLPIYLDCGAAWRRDLAVALSRRLQRPVNLEDTIGDPLKEVVASRPAGLVVILDHLEQLLWLEESEVRGLAQLISNILGRQGTVVGSIDQGHIHALEALSSKVPAVAGAQTIRVERLGRRRAGKVMEQTVLAGGGYMEAGLPELIAEELTAEGPVLPATLQAVGHSAVLQGATSAKRFSRAGGGQALASLHVERLVARSGGWRARQVLAVLSESPNPRASLPLTPIAQGCGLRTGVTRSVLDALVKEGLVTCQEDPLAIKGEPNYAILHPYLLQSIRDTVASVHRGRAQARLSLRRRIHGGGVLRPDELVRIWRYLGQAITEPERDQVKRGVRIWSLAVAGILALPALALLVVYLMLAISSFVDTAPGLPGHQRVVVRSGRPSLSFAFNMTSAPFGQVQVDTGFLFSSLPDKLQQRVVNNELIGDQDLEKPGVPYWLTGLFEPLPPVRRGALQILAGDADEGSQILQHAAASEVERERATRALALLSGDTAQTLAALQLCMKDPRLEVRRMAVTEARRLTFSRAGVVLSMGIKDADNNIRLAALQALGQSDPGDLLGLLASCTTDSDPRVQAEALSQLERTSKKHPVRVFEIARRLQASKSTRNPELDRLLHQIQDRAPRRLADHLVSLVTNSKDDRIRAEALQRLASMPDKGIEPQKLVPVVSQLATHRNPTIRAAAITLQARFGNPEEVMVELTKLAYMITPRKEAALMRHAAAAGLGLVRARPDREHRKLLRRLLRDPDRKVRAAAAESLVNLGTAGLAEVVKGIKQGPKDVAIVALHAVCSKIKIDRRVATTVLATAWKVKRVDLRGRALRCARKLVAANPRLSLWLADQARLDKKPEVRRAAADALALAMKKGGARAEQLLQFYLRQGDASVTAAVLRAMSQTPPRRTGSLFKRIVKVIDHKDARVRAAVAPLVVIAAPRHAQACTALNMLLKDPDPQVVKAALKAAAKLRPGSSTRILDQTLAGVVSAARSRAALEALAVARSLKLSKPIQRAAMHPEPDVRAAAVELLTRAADPNKALAVLKAAQLDPEPAIRLAALKATAKQSARLKEKAIELLKNSTEAKSPAERWAAFEALGQVKGEGIPAAVGLLARMGKDRSEERRALAMRSLGKLAPRSKDAALALMEGTLDPALDVRIEAQGALAEYLGRYCPLTVLLKLLIASEQNGLQRHLAISSLAWSGRLHGQEELSKAVAKITRSSSLSVVTRMGARLALALSRRAERPEEVIGWLFGW